VPDNDHTYVIDVDVLARIHVRKDSEETYSALVEMAQGKKLRTVRQTFDELKKFGSQYERLRRHRDAFQIPADDQFHADVAGFIEILGNEADFLWTQTGGRNLIPLIRG
jgi:hypothetical protein